MGKKLIFRRIGGRIVPILKSGNVDQILKPKGMFEDITKTSIENTRKLRESFKKGDYSKLRENEQLQQSLALDKEVGEKPFKNKWSGDKIAEMIRRLKKK